MDGVGRIRLRKNTIQNKLDKTKQNKKKEKERAKGNKTFRRLLFGLILARSIAKMEIGVNPIGVLSEDGIGNLEVRTG